MNLKVKKENALIAYEAADEKGKKLLADLFPGQIIPISIRERIENGDVITFEDILSDQGITVDDFAKRIANDTEDEADWKRAKLIAKSINVTPLKNGEYWYVPIFNKSSSGFSFAFIDSWFTYAAVGARLHGFRKRSDAEYAGKTFQNIYKSLV
jgi:hypothetical protein